MIIVFACSSENDKNADADHEPPQLSFEDVGRLHNEGLDFVLNYLVDIDFANSPTTRSTADISNLICDATDAFMKEKGLTTLILGLNTRTASEVDIYSSLNEGQLYYVNRIMDLLADESLSVGEFQQAISEIENEIPTVLSEEDARPILCGTSVAKYTAQYWSENLYKWIEALSEQGAPQSRGWFSWKDVAGEDVAGAVGGAIGGAAAGALVGGVGAGPGALAGGIAVGVGGSASSAVIQVWNWLWE